MMASPEQTSVRRQGVISVFRLVALVLVIPWALFGCLLNGVAAPLGFGFASPVVFLWLPGLVGSVLFLVGVSRSSKGLARLPFWSIDEAWRRLWGGIGGGRMRLGLALLTASTIGWLITFGIKS